MGGIQHGSEDIDETDPSAIGERTQLSIELFHLRQHLHAARARFYRNDRHIGARQVLFHQAEEVCVIAEYLLDRFACGKVVVAFVNDNKGWMISLHHAVKVEEKV